MNKVLIMLAITSMVGCSANMSTVPSNEELDAYSSPNEFIKSALDYDITGLGLIQHPDEEILRPSLSQLYGEDVGGRLIFFRAYFTMMNDTHLYKPLISAKAYCIHQGGTFNLVVRDSTENIFKLDAQRFSFTQAIKMEILGRQRYRFSDLAHDAWQAGAFGTHECVNANSNWLITILPYNFIQSDGSSDDAHIADLLVYVGKDHL